MEPKQKKQKQKERLTESKIQALKPSDAPYSLMDTETRSFGIQVQPTGAKSFVMYRRFPGSSVPVRRLIGHYDNGIGRPTKEEVQEKGEREIVPGMLMSLAEARKLADLWLASIHKGIDPARAAEQEKKANIEAERKRITNTIDETLKSYLLAKASLRSVDKRGRDLKRTLKPWLSHAIEDVSEDDIVGLINEIKARGRQPQARYILVLLCGFFSWAVKKRKIKISPCASIDASELVGDPVERERALDDAEIRAYWRAAEQLEYPEKQLFQILMLSGLRRAEVSDTIGDEIDLDAQRWVIPKERMKGKPGKARPHLVPIVGLLTDVLSGLPEHAHGPYVLSVTGAHPFSDFTRAKARLDALMRTDLEAQGITFKPFQLRDVRRTVRTRLSSLKVPLEIRERILAHARPQLERIYDVYEFEGEKGEGLEKWHQALTGIIEGNVIDFRRKRA